MKQITIQLDDKFPIGTKPGDSVFLAVNDDGTAEVRAHKSEAGLLDDLIQEMWEEEPTDEVRERFRDKVIITKIGSVISADPA